MKKNLLLVLALMTASAVRASLVVNGGFETGTFSGWTQFGNTGTTAVSGAFGGISPHSGSKQAVFGPAGSIGGIQQTLSVTAGQTYQITLWLYNFGGSPNEFQLKWGGSTILDMVNSTAFPYTQITQTVTANGATDVLSLGFQQNPQFFMLDDVSVDAVSVVPEPTTVIAGVLLLLPLGVGAVRQFRNKARTV